MRKQTRRKIYSTAINPITHALLGAALIPEKELDQLRLRELAAIEAFRAGRAGLQDWRDITALMNLCEQMARDGIGREALEACERAQTALIDAAHRYERTAKMGTTGPGLQAFRDVYEFHDLQRQSVPRSVYEQCIARVTNRVRGKAPEVVVLR